METENLAESMMESEDTDTAWVWLTMSLVTISVLVTAFSLPHIVTLFQIISLINSFSE